MIKRDRQIRRKVFDFIQRYISTNEESPTLAEIGSHVGLRSPASVYDILVALENQGLIKRTPNVSRGIEIVQKPITPICGWIDR